MEGHRFPSGQRQTSYIFAGPAKFGTTSLGCPTAPTCTHLTLRITIYLDLYKIL